MRHTLGTYCRRKGERQRARVSVYTDDRARGGPLKEFECEKTIKLLTVAIQFQYRNGTFGLGPRCWHYSPAPLCLRFVHAVLSAMLSQQQPGGVAAFAPATASQELLLGKRLHTFTTLARGASTRWAAAGGITRQFEWRSRFFSFKRLEARAPT